MDPFSRIMKEKNMTYEEMAILLDIDTNRIYEFKKGRYRNIPKNAAELFTLFGENPDKIREEYRDYRKNLALKLMNKMD